MGRQISVTLVFVAMQFLILNGGCGNAEMGNWRDGPVICRGMCEESEGFHTIQEINCRRIHANASSSVANSSSNSGLICLTMSKTMNNSDNRTIKINCSRFDTESGQELSEHDRTLTLHQACMSGKLHVVQFILSQGKVDINRRDRYGRTPILLSALVTIIGVFDFLVCKGSDLVGVDPRDNILHEVCNANLIVMVKHILSMNLIDIESPGSDAWTPVMVAANRGNVEIFDFLVAKGCNLRVLDKFKNNILHLACKSESVEMVKRIFSLNISDIDARGQYDKTPVMFAAMEDSASVFDFLVKKGCNLNLTDKYHNTCFHWACKGSSVNIVKHILSQNLFDVDVKGEVGRTPLMSAAASGQIAVFDFLIKSGANVTQFDRANANVLHLACTAYSTEMISHILSLNIVSCDCRDTSGWTPVFYAASRGDTDAVKIFESKGCNMTTEDNEGGNIFNAALSADSGNVKTVRYLLTVEVLKGLEKNKNRFGETPYQWAVKTGNKEVAEQLKNMLS